MEGMVPRCERRRVYGERDYKLKWRNKDSKMRMGSEDEDPCQLSDRPGVDRDTACPRVRLLPTLHSCCLWH